MKIILTLFIGLIAVAAIAIATKPELRLRIFAEKSNLTTSELINEINQYRSKRNQQNSDKSLSQLKTDDKFNSLLKKIYQTHDSKFNNDLDKALEKFTEQVPGLISASSLALNNATRSKISQQFQNWHDIYSEENNYAYAVVTPNIEGFLYNVIIILAQKIPHFDLKQADSNQQKFYDICPVCRQTNTVNIQSISDNTIILQCGYCHKSYNIIARNYNLDLKYATEYIKKFDPFSKKFNPQNNQKNENPTSQQSKAEILHIWQELKQRVTYKRDGNLLKRTEELWLTPKETYDFKFGDCEDSSILLASVLRTRGYDARVALGRIDEEDVIANFDNPNNINDKEKEFQKKLRQSKFEPEIEYKSQLDRDGILRNNHAWCVVKYNGTEYLLETTNSMGLAKKYIKEKILPTSASLDHKYFPVHQFDNSDMYFIKREFAQKNDFSKNPIKSYWDENIWYKVKQKKSQDTK